MMCCSVALYGEIHGPRRLTPSMTARIAEPVSSATGRVLIGFVGGGLDWGSLRRQTSYSSIPNPRIEPRVEQISPEVGQRVYGRDDQHAHLEQRDIAVLDRVDDQAAHSGVGEHLFDDDDAAH